MDFPQIEKNQFALLMASGDTGQILNKNLTIYFNESNEDPYTIFDRLEDAHSFINEITFQNSKIEFIIYDSSQKVVYYTE